MTLHIDALLGRTVKRSVSPYFSCI